MPAKKELTKKPIKKNELSIPVYSLAGKENGSLDLPKELFGQKVNEALLAQAVRVYQTNQRVLPGSTKTRGEVMGSTAKIWRQKGTGRARHGSIMAPIFVGGGIAFGPKARKVILDLPKKMKKAALISACSLKAKDGEVLGLAGLEKASGKTQEIVKLLKKLNSGSTLIVTSKKMDNVIRGTRNISGVDVLPAYQLNAFEILRHKNLIVTQESLEKLVSPKESQND